MATAQDVHHRGDGKANGMTQFATSSTRLVTDDPAMKQISDVVTQVADTDVTVLIVGESGTGKELIARELHQQSSRRNSPFLAVNCGAIAESLQESELFGHTRGAFTDAVSAKVGKIEAAEGGTLFLDEIGEMKPGLQVTLLRLLQSGEYAPVGMAQNRLGNVRVVAATNRELPPLMESGAFRRDLYYRLNVIRLDVPPLRDRPTDIPLLIDHYLQTFRRAYGKPNLDITVEVRTLLSQYDFPGNVRELENILRRGIILCRGAAVSTNELPPEVRATRPPARGRKGENFRFAKARMIAEFEREYLVAALTACAGIASRAARGAGLSERHFHEKLRKYGLSTADFRPRTDSSG